VAVLSHGGWSRLFGADPEVLGQSIVVNGEPVAVLGVLIFVNQADGDLGPPPRDTPKRRRTDKK